MAISQSTLEQSWTCHRSATEVATAPGLLQLFSNGQARLTPIPLGAGTHVLGRARVGSVEHHDSHMSREHAQVSFDGRSWHIKDLGSRNGTFVDGKRIRGTLVTEKGRVLRVGDSIFGLMSDLQPFAGAEIARSDDVLIGPTLRRAWVAIESAAQLMRGLHIVGESGTGKELGARQFHRAGPRAKAPFVAVNCADIPAQLAERLLFGAKKGAYSGADSNSDGYLQAADGGVLFLDEIGELDPLVQAKLLRLLETKELLVLGASRPRSVDVVVCSATHADLRALAAAGKFREDLLFRLATPSVVIPPLRSRIEEIPGLIQYTLEKTGRTPHVSLIDTCLVRPWPGNVRELLAEVRQAAAAAARESAKQVQSSHLGKLAGLRFGTFAAPGHAPDDAAIIEVLRREGGNVSGAARALGMHVTQLRRFIARNARRAEAKIVPDDSDESEDDRDD